MVSFRILLMSAKNGVTKKVCESTLIALVIIHTKFQLHWMFETKVKWVRHFAPPPPFPPSALSMIRVRAAPALIGLINSFQIYSICAICVLAT